MIVYYLDASAWVKRYYVEPGTGWIQDFFSREPMIACATLGKIEVAATLARKGKSLRIPSGVLDQKAHELDQDWKSFIHIHLDDEAIATAVRIVSEHALRGADAVHLASALLLAERLDSGQDRVTVITSDDELKWAARRSGLTVLDPVDTE